MNIEEVREFCLSLPETTESMPFGEGFLVFKVLDKVFAIIALARFPVCVNLKCDPDWAIELRDQYPQITAGYHMNKNHWNSIEPEALPNSLTKKMIMHSYSEVIKKMPKKLREKINFTEKDTL